MEGAAGDLANLEYFIGQEEVVEGVVDIFLRDCIFSCEKALDDLDILAGTDRCMRFPAGPESLLDIVGC